MYNARQIAAMVDSMARAINARGLRAPLLIGIHTGGAYLAEQLQPRLHGGNGGDGSPPLGSIDISFYRDDFSRVGLNPEVKASELPVAVDDRDIILVDDVLHTGRTIRAALNEIFSYGRPQRICLAALIERPGRELPIQADIVGESLDLSARQEAKLSRDNNGDLALDIIDLGDGDGGDGPLRHPRSPRLTERGGDEIGSGDGDLSRHPRNPLSGGGDGSDGDGAGDNP